MVSECWKTFLYMSKYICLIGKLHTDKKCFDHYTIFVLGGYLKLDIQDLAVKINELLSSWPTGQTSWLRSNNIFWLNKFSQNHFRHNLYQLWTLCYSCSSLSSLNSEYTKWSSKILTSLLSSKAATVHFTKIYFASVPTPIHVHKRGYYTI